MFNFKNIKKHSIVLLKSEQTTFLFKPNLTYFGIKGNMYFKDRSDYGVTFLDIHGNLEHAITHSRVLQVIDFE